jgi:hypothetical protein
VPVLLASAAVALVALAYVLLRVKRARVARATGAAARARFASHFAARSAPEELLVHTYDVLQQRRASETADVQPAAHLRRDFGLTRLDLEDVALVIVARVGGRMPGAEDLDRLEAQVTTVDDLVGFLAPFCSLRAA